MSKAIFVALILCLLTVADSCGQLPQEQVSPENQEIPDTILSWDNTEKEQSLINGETMGAYSFKMTNISNQPLEIRQINVSCGCTSVTGKTTPFTLKAGETESLSVRMNVQGKTGEVTKSIYVMTNRGNKTLLVTAKIFPIAEASTDPAGNAEKTLRDQNLLIAKTDRQAVFKTDCAACHAKPAEEKFGQALYQSACAICHDAVHRASMVPDLRLSKEVRDAAYWRGHISNGKEGTLMPAFAKTKQGILSDEQIESLVNFLLENPPKVSPNDKLSP